MVFDINMPLNYYIFAAILSWSRGRWYREVTAMASIKKYKDGRYHTQIYLGKDENGNRKTISIAGKTEKEVLKRRQEIEYELANSIDILAGNAMFSVWAEKWLAQKKATISASHFNFYICELKRVNNYLGSMPIRKIQVHHVQNMINEYALMNPATGNPTAKRTLKSYKETASQVFEFAIMNRAIVFNPAEYVQIPRDAPVSERRALTEDECHWIDICEHRMKSAAMIMLYAGLRRGEVIPLEWSDIDLKNRLIFVRKAVELVGNEAIIKSPKTKAGYRQVYICDHLLEYLNSIPSNQTGLVCADAHGMIFTKDSFRRAWKSYLVELSIVSGINPERKSRYDPRFSGIDISNITPHMLRHTFCTMMHENGVDILTAKQQMGHSDVKTTMNTYTHITSSFSRDEMSKMDNFQL